MISAPRCRALISRWLFERQKQELDIRLPLGRFLDFRENAGAFRVVGGLSPGQHQLAGEITPGQAKGLNDPQGILKGIESRNLQNDRLIPFHPQAVEHCLDLFRSEVPVFFTQGIDSGVHQVLGMRQKLGEAGHGEDRGVILAHRVAAKTSRRSGPAGKYRCGSARSSISPGAHMFDQKAGCGSLTTTKSASQVNFRAFSRLMSR